MTTRLISVIIPIYNSEKYLRKCLNSVANQTFTNFEVVMVNDASTDNSIEIAKEFVLKYENFNLIDLENNKGVSVVRNVAIEASVGKYLAFLDSDDTMDTDFLEVMYATIIKNNAQVAYCNYRVYHEKTNTARPVILRKPPKGIYTGKKMCSMTIADFFSRSYLWNKLWDKRLFISEPQVFFPDMYYEDLAITSLLLYKADTVVVINDLLINYTIMRKGSIVSSMTEQKLNDYHTTLYVLRNFIEMNNSFKPFAISFIRIAVSMFFCLPFNILRIKNPTQKRLSLFKESVAYIYGAISKKYYSQKIDLTDVNTIPVEIKESFSQQHISNTDTNKDEFELLHFED